MPVLAVWLINKSGGLIYQKDFPTESVSPAKLTTNDFLVLASTFQSVHAISTQLNPIQAKSGGIESIDWYGYGNRSLESQRSSESHAAGQHTDQNNININTGKPSSTPFKLTNFQSPTGLKILLLTSPRQPQLEYILKRIYELYADFVMKNPFHTPEMPVRSEKFDVNLAKLVRQMSTSNYF